MSRNTGGTYALPTGNPVVGGTTISTTWANETLGDLAAEMTDSLCRSGKGGMLAPLEVDAGTVAAPGVTWAVDPDTGIYRVGANSVGMSAGSTQVQRWETTGTTITGTAAVSGAVTLSSTAAVTGAGTFAAGITITQSTSNGAGLTATGNGTNAGVLGTGGATGGPGVSGTGGAPNGYGGSFIGAGIGVGVEGQGGTSGAGGLFRPGTAATATVRATAVTANNGDITFTGVVAPNSNVAISNTVTAKNVVKAWAYLTASGSGSTTVTVQDGFNVSSAACSGTSLTVTFASAFSGTGYVAFCNPINAKYLCSVSITSSTVATITARDADAAFAAYDFQAGANTSFFILALGAQ
jgi:hypothetical protein